MCGSLTVAILPSATAYIAPEAVSIGILARKNGRAIICWKQIQALMARWVRTNFLEHSL
jgi:hypothetical protein